MHRSGNQLPLHKFITSTLRGWGSKPKLNELLIKGAVPANRPPFDQAWTLLWPPLKLYTHNINISAAWRACVCVWLWHQGADRCRARTTTHHVVDAVSQSSWRGRARFCSLRWCVLAHLGVDAKEKKTNYDKIRAELSTK